MKWFKNLVENEPTLLYGFVQSSFGLALTIAGWQGVSFPESVVGSFWIWTAAGFALLSRGKVTPTASLPDDLKLRTKNGH